MASLGLSFPASSLLSLGSSSHLKRLSGILFEPGIKSVSICCLCCFHLRKELVLWPRAEVVGMSEANSIHIVTFGIYFIRKRFRNYLDALLRLGGLQPCLVDPRFFLLVRQFASISFETNAKYAF